MIYKVSTIVEGHGEVEALPILLRRVCEWKTPGIYAEFPMPIRVHRDRFLNRDEEFRRHLLLASSKSSDNGWVLILLDADNDCPVVKSTEILQRAQEVLPHKAVSVVLANREYEAWFIAAAASLHGQRGFNYNSAQVVDAEVPRNAKGWLAERMGGKGYGEVIDQPAFTAKMNLHQAFEGSRSFRKLCKEWLTQTERHNV